MNKDFSRTSRILQQLYREPRTLRVMVVDMYICILFIRMHTCIHVRVQRESEGEGEGEGFLRRSVAYCVLLECKIYIL
jgi:hypothetical protein